MANAWTERVCKDCGRMTDSNRFATFRNRDGTVGRRGVCKDCRGKYAESHVEELREWRRQYNAANKTKRQLRGQRVRAEARTIVNAFKDVPCSDCGRRFPSVAMDLDHVRGDKVMDVARMVGCCYKIELIQLELEKCEVVCACCHRVRTHLRGENAAPNQKSRMKQKP